METLLQQLRLERYLQPFEEQGVSAPEDLTICDWDDVQTCCSDIAMKSMEVARLKKWYMAQTGQAVSEAAGSAHTVNIPLKAPAEPALTPTAQKGDGKVGQEEESTTEPPPRDISGFAFLCLNGLDGALKTDSIEEDGRKQLCINDDGWASFSTYEEGWIHRRVWKATFDAAHGIDESTLTLPDGRQLYTNLEGELGVAHEGKFTNTDPARRTWMLRWIPHDWKPFAVTLENKHDDFGNLGVNSTSQYWACSSQPGKINFRTMTESADIDRPRYIARLGVQRVQYRGEDKKGQEGGAFWGVPGWECDHTVKEDGDVFFDHVTVDKEDIDKYIDIDKEDIDKAIDKDIDKNTVAANECPSQYRCSKCGGEIGELTGNSWNDRGTIRYFRREWSGNGDGRCGGCS